jgi:hypothetical protein
MDLNTYVMYASATAIIALIVIVIALSIKSWFDESTFTSNLLLTRQFEQMDRERFMSSTPMSFDRHVATTPGMHDHTLN